MNSEKSFIAQILPEAASVLKAKGHKKNTYTYEKGYLADADNLVHEFITNAILKRFEEDVVLSEEGEVALLPENRTDRNTWIVDPICGTLNYVSGIPFFVQSLSVLDKNGVLCAGIYDMNQNELFLADRFETTLNGIKVSASQTRKLNEALVAVNCNQSAWKGEGLMITDLVDKFAPPVTRRIHILESANLEMAYVACGRLDAYINPDDKIWDIAAWTLMIGSAGGAASILSGDISDLAHCKGIIASNEFLIEQLKALYEN